MGTAPGQLPDPVRPSAPGSAGRHEWDNVGWTGAGTKGQRPELGGNKGQEGTEVAAFDPGAGHGEGKQNTPIGLRTSNVRSLWVQTDSINTRKFCRSLGLSSAGN